MAVLWTVVLCLAIEALLLLVLTAIMGSLLGATLVSILLLGPVSWWLAKPLYRYILRAGE